MKQEERSFGEYASRICQGQLTIGQALLIDLLPVSIGVKHDTTLAQSLTLGFFDLFLLVVLALTMIWADHVPQSMEKCTSCLVDWNSSLFAGLSSTQGYMVSRLVRDSLGTDAASMAYYL